MPKYLATKNQINALSKTSYSFALVLGVFLCSTFSIKSTPVVIVSAQGTNSSSGVAITIDGTDLTFAPGDIISYKDGKFKLSDELYDSNMYGVVVERPVVSLEDTLLQKSYLVLSEGIALVKVSSSSGLIKNGDFVTSSKKSGIGEKATTSGQVLGVALEDAFSENADETDTILVHLDIRANFINSNVRTNLIEALRSGVQAPFLTPLTSLRYILAALIVGGAFVVGFASFGKTSGGGVEALGRNPLAKRAIQATILFNFVLTGVIMFVGLLLAYLVLVL